MISEDPRAETYVVQRFPNPVLVPAQGPAQPDCNFVRLKSADYSMVTTLLHPLVTIN